MEGSLTWLSSVARNRPLELSHQRRHGSFLSHVNSFVRYGSLFRSSIISAVWILLAVAGAWVRSVCKLFSADTTTDEMRTVAQEKGEAALNSTGSYVHNQQEAKDLDLHVESEPDGRQ